MAPITGRSLTEIFTSDKSGQVIPQRDHVLISKERTDVGRPQDEGYPIRGIVKGGMLYVHNFEPDRWPGGNPVTGYMDTDGSPTKTEVLKTRYIVGEKQFWELCFGKLPADQIFDVNTDPDCLTNLAAKVSFAALQQQVFDELRQQGDPRMLGDGHVFDEYPNASPERGYYEKFMSGNKGNPLWINPSDFQPSDD
jgi:N-sulfoglucosamine sulfohydrolase